MSRTIFETTAETFSAPLRRSGRSLFSLILVAIFIPILCSGCISVGKLRGFRDSQELISLDESRFQVESINVSPYGDILAVGYSSMRDKSNSQRDYPVVRLWSLEEEIPQLIGTKEVRDISVQKPQFSKDAKRLILAEESGWMNIDLEYFASNNKYGCEQVPFDSIRVLSKNAVFGASRAEDETWSIVELETQSKRLSLPEEVERVLAFSDSGRYIAAREKNPVGLGRGQERVVIWNLAEHTTSGGALTKMCTIDLEHYTDASLCSFSPDENFLVLKNSSRTLGIWSVRTGKQIAELEHNETINAFTFSPKEKKIAVCTSGKYANVYLWDMRKAKILQQQKDRSTERMTAVVFANDEKHIYTGDINGNVKKWQIKK